MKKYLFLAILVMSVSCHMTREMVTIGEVARIRVMEADMDFLSRIDTGAKTISLHAIDIDIDGELPIAKKNIGKIIRFTTLNEESKKKKIKTEIVGVSTIKNSQGVESRYVVELTFSIEGKVAKRKVNLRDRSSMTYKLLIGRNGLEDILVDVSK